MKIGKWHAGRWIYGMPVVKIEWMKEGTRLSSGFVLSRNVPEIEALVQQIRWLVGEQAASCAQHAHAEDAAKQRG